MRSSAPKTTSVEVVSPAMRASIDSARICVWIRSSSGRLAMRWRAMTASKNGGIAGGWFIASRSSAL